MFTLERPLNHVGRYYDNDSVFRSSLLSVDCTMWRCCWCWNLRPKRNSLKYFNFLLPWPKILNKQLGNKLLGFCRYKMYIYVLITASIWVPSCLLLLPLTWTPMFSPRPASPTSQPAHNIYVTARETRFHTHKITGNLGCLSLPFLTCIPITK
jgi:hypothetical protein